MMTLGLGCGICAQWRRWIRPMVIALYILIMCVVLPFLVYEMRGQGVKREVWFVGGLFALVTLPLSLWGILQHLIHYTKPEFQRHVIRILWMVPIYSLNALLGMRFPKHSVYFDSLRECYEAYVIYNFMRYLLNYLYSEYDLEDTLALKRPVRHLFPFCLFRPWTMGKELIVRSKHGALQYTVVRPVTTAIAFLCQLAGVYGVGDFDPKKAFVYLLFVNNVSQIFALYCLVLFYVATKEELMPIQPVGKFFSVKCIVFASFWQGMLITILVNANIIPKDLWGEKSSKADCSQGLQDFLICIEMFIAAVAHIYVFSHDPYITEDTRAIAPCCQSFMSMWDVSDMRDDVYEHMRVMRGRLMQAGGAGGNSPRYEWKDARAGESSRLLRSASSNHSLASGYVSDNGPLNPNNNNNNNNQHRGGGGYSSDSDGGGGSVGFRRARASTIGMVTLVNDAADRERAGFHNPLEGVTETDELPSPLQPLDVALAESSPVPLILDLRTPLQGDLSNPDPPLV